MQANLLTGDALGPDVTAAASGLDAPAPPTPSSSPEPGSPPHPPAPQRSRRPRRFWRYALGGALGLPLLAWGGLHWVPSFGPAVADGIRAWVGPAPVAWLEDVVYGLEDRINLIRFQSAAPKTLWDEEALPPPPRTHAGELELLAQERPAAEPLACDDRPQAPAPEEEQSLSPPCACEAAAPPSLTQEPALDAASLPSAPVGFTLSAVMPPFASVAAPGDGEWAPLADPMHPEAPASMLRTLVHPDPKRSFAAVAVVALDRRLLRLHLVPGTHEPESHNVPRERRTGKVAPEHQAKLVAAFNGGFKATHGHYGMRVGEDQLLPPQQHACTIGLRASGEVDIRTWTKFHEEEGKSLVAYRQTPPCLLEEGSTHQALSLEFNRNWGATVSGDTVIRRSALGVDRSGEVVFYALGDAVTAQALAVALRAVGAWSAAQLDVNYSFPRFVTFLPAEGSGAPRVSQGLIRDLKFTRGEYVEQAQPRDFFYLTRND